jgi:hypothetical protein
VLLPLIKRSIGYNRGKGIQLDGKRKAVHVTYAHTHIPTAHLTTTNVTDESRESSGAHRPEKEQDA